MTSYDLLVSGDVDEQLNPSYGRLPTLALKVALILASLDWCQVEEQNVPRITAAHMARALLTVESWRLSLHRAIAIAATATADQVSKRVLKQVARAGSVGISRRDIAYRCRTGSCGR